MRRTLMITAAAAALVMMGGGVANAAIGWTVQTAPPPADSQQTVLYGVSCTSAANCTAVGYYRSGGGGLTLAEHWDGTAWSVQTTPNPAGENVGSAYLDGVSCASATSCTAVGEYGNPSGSAQYPLAEHWDGSTWTIQATPRPKNSAHAGLDAVSCPSATSCTAVGSAGAEHWNGTAWRVEATPVAAGLKDVTWNGISCVSGPSCVAVGQSGNSASTTVTLAEQRTGLTWSALPSASPGSTWNALTSVSCRTATSCTAVGQYANSSGPGLVLAEHWNGSAWTVQTTVNPGSGGSASLESVSCPLATNCTAVGSYVTRAGVTATLVEHWGGSEWRTQRPINPPTYPHRYLDGVSCAKATGCTAVGWMQPRSGALVTLAEAN